MRKGFYFKNYMDSDKELNERPSSQISVMKQLRGQMDSKDCLEKKQILSEYTPKQQDRLKEIMSKIKHEKDKKRAHSLVMNLPSRMLKSFNGTKFDLLNDKSYIYDEQIFQQSISTQKDQTNSDIMSQKQFPLVRQITKRKSQLQNYLILQQIQKNQSEVRAKKLCHSLLWKKFANYFNRLNDNGQKIIAVVLQYINSIPILQPSSVIKLIWDLLNMVVSLACIFYLPITIIFNFTFSQLIKREVICLIPVCLILDIIININTGYFKKGQVIKSRKKIITRFLKNRFFTDVLSILPLVYTLFQELFNDEYDKSISPNSNYSSDKFIQMSLLLFLFKILTLSSTILKMEERFNMSNIQINILQLVKLLTVIILINHFFACLWVYTAKLQEQSGISKTWMSYEDIDQKSWSKQYIAAFYFTTVTMITVGYGDILPKNELEMMLCITTMIIACGVFGYSLNEVGVIFNNFFEVNNKIKKQILQIQRYMSKNNINSNLQFQIREYLEYYWREQSENNSQQEQEIIKQLSESLRTKLLFEANKIALKDSPIFKHNFSKNVIEQTVPLIHQLKFTPESFICQKGTQDDQSIYFIENGSVEIVLDSKQKNTRSLQKMSKGESFGEYTFFTGLPQIYNIRSREFTTVLKIRRSDFLQLLQRFPEDLENFCNIRDQISYLDDYSKINLKCQSCNSNHHAVSRCQYIHYVPNKAKVIKKYNDIQNIQNFLRCSFQRRVMNQNYQFKNSRAVYGEVVRQASMFQALNQSLFNLSDEGNIYTDGYFHDEFNDSIKIEQPIAQKEYCENSKIVTSSKNNTPKLVTEATPKNRIFADDKLLFSLCSSFLNEANDNNIEIQDNGQLHKINTNQFNRNHFNYFNFKGEIQKQISPKNIFEKQNSNLNRRCSTEKSYRGIDISPQNNQIIIPQIQIQENWQQIIQHDQQSYKQKRNRSIQDNQLVSERLRSISNQSLSNPTMIHRSQFDIRKCYAEQPSKDLSKFLENQQTFKQFF